MTYHGISVELMDASTTLGCYTRVLTIVWVSLILVMILFRVGSTRQVKMSSHQLPHITPTAARSRRPAEADERLTSPVTTPTRRGCPASAGRRGRTAMSMSAITECCPGTLFEREVRGAWLCLLPRLSRLRLHLPRLPAEAGDHT
jgi:hypothetical protein